MKTPEMDIDTPNTTEQKILEEQKKEFEQSLDQFYGDAKIEGPITLRRSYEDSDVEQVLDEVEITDLEYNLNYNELSMKIKLPDDNELDTDVRTMKKEKTRYEDDKVITEFAKDEEKGYYTTQVFTKGGYMGVTLNIDAQHLSAAKPEDIKIRSIGMPESHQTPFVQNLIKKIIELKKEK